MTRLAVDVHIGPAGRVAIGSKIIVLLQIGGMAARALIVPSLVASGPMEAIASAQDLGGVKGKPALTALCLRTAVPGDAERLIAATRKGDQILLKRKDAEGVGDFIIMRRAVRPLGPHHEFIAIARKNRGDAVMGERCVGEITKDRGGIRLLHGESVMRSLPAFGLRRMTTGASPVAGECAFLSEGWRQELQAEKQRREPTRLHWRPFPHRSTKR